MSTRELKFAHLVPDTWKKLEKLPRTCYVMWNVPNPETVAEHTVALIKLAHELRPKLNVTDSEFERIVEILEIHDWGESLIGDIVLEAFPKDQWFAVIAEKMKDELEAMQEICSPLGVQGEYILELFNESEKRETKASNIAYHIDKIQADMKAVEYEKKYGIKGISLEFLDYDKNRYSLPLFKEIWQSLWDDPEIYKGEVV